MNLLLSPASLAREVEGLAAGRFLQDPAALLADGVSLLRPPERISTVECAEKYRKIATPKGDGVRPWSRDLTPYNVGPMDALDDPAVQEVIMPKPARSGGTVAFECYAFKLMRFGPMGDIGWYLKSDSEVKAYADKGFRELFTLHREIAAKIGPGRGDDRDDHKLIDGRSFDVLPANPTKFTNRQYSFMVGDEIDTYQPRICASFLDQARIRGRALGANRKVGMASHPDRGWATGIAAAWLDTSRGIYVMPCAECGLWASPYPTKHWPGVERFRLFYQRAEEGAERDVRIRLAESSAAVECPHCHALLDDDQRHAMVDVGEWLHRGQTLDLTLGICGARESNSAMGFWVHGLMSKMISNAELARDLESALAHYETTRRIERLREVTAKVFGEVFEGAAGSGVIDVAALIKRREIAADRGEGFGLGSVPPGVLFLTQSVDVGHGKFDVMVRGWDREGRSWLIDRATLRQRVWPDGQVRDIRPTERIEDWYVLEPLIDRLVPLRDDAGAALPIAVTLIDAGDGNVTWKAYEFARRMDQRRWGEFRAVKVIKGAASAKAPELGNPTPIAKDQEGREVRPVIRLVSLGVHRLKELELERLAVEDGGPGQWRFADGLSRRHLEEFFGERLIGGSWERHGDNETLDLAAYCEAGRLMLQPDRRDIKWTDAARRPLWARPVRLGGAGPVGPAPAGSEPDTIFQRYERLNPKRRREPDG